MADDNFQFKTGPVFENGPRYEFKPEIKRVEQISTAINVHELTNLNKIPNQSIIVNSNFDPSKPVINNQNKAISAKLPLDQLKTNTIKSNNSGNMQNNNITANIGSETNKKPSFQGNIIANSSSANINPVSSKQNISTQQQSINPVSENTTLSAIDQLNMQQPPIIPDELRNQYYAKRQSVLQLYADGKFLDSVNILLALINETKLAGHLDAEDFVLMATIMHAMKHTRASVDALRECMRYKGDDLSVMRNYATALQFNQQFQESIEILNKILAKGEAKYTDYDGMASALGEIGQITEAQKYGSMALNLRAREIAEKSPINWQLPPRKAFRPEQVKRNIVSFSLWGNKPRYIESAIENAVAMPYIYPSWRARFYCDDSVPKAVLNKLTELGAEILMQPNNRSYEGLFWRFAVASDPMVDFFLVRDADSIINVQERVAVDEWLQSDRLFHVMRDYFTHSELILAGLWGGQGNALPNIINMANAYRTTELFTRTIDQNILRDCIWPMVEKSVLMHDSQFTFRDSQAFPAYGRLPPGQHVGQSKRV